MSVSSTVGELAFDPRPAVVVEREPVWRRLLRRPAGAMAVGVLALLVLSAVVAPIIAPYSPTELGVGPPNAGPSGKHLFGTDELGRDTFSRVVYGGRLALSITAGATAIAIAIGTAWGSIAAVIGGVVDDVMMRIVDAMVAIPFLLLALILVAGFGASTSSLILVLGIVNVPLTVRVIRAAVLSELHREYVLAARAFGSSTRRLLWSEILPNVAPTILVQSSVVASTVLLTEAALSFVGLGISPPQASWGTLILEGYNNINVAPIQIIFPGVVMFVAVWAISVLAEQLQAVLDTTEQVRIGAQA